MNAIDLVHTKTTNDLKKGDRILLACGWFATMADNKKGDTRMATVEGFFTETGSVYSHDIMFYVSPEGQHVPIKHTLKQESLRRLVA